MIPSSAGWAGVANFAVYNIRDVTGEHGSLSFQAFANWSSQSLRLRRGISKILVYSTTVWDESRWVAFPAIKAHCVTVDAIGPCNSKTIFWTSDVHCMRQVRGTKSHSLAYYFYYMGNDPDVLCSELFTGCSADAPDCADTFCKQEAQ